MTTAWLSSSQVAELVLAVEATVRADLQPRLDEARGTNANLQRKLERIAEDVRAAMEQWPDGHKRPTIRDIWIPDYDPTKRDLSVADREKRDA